MIVYLGKSEASLLFIYLRKLVLMEEQRSIQCTSPVGSYSAVCSSEHERLGILRCHKCLECENYRKWKITSLLDHKLTKFISRKGRSAKYIQLWTFGTDLDDSMENRVVISILWHHFRRCYSKWLKSLGKSTNFLFYVIEAGSTGGKLHIHTVGYGFSPHEKLRTMWKLVSGIAEPNVNYSRSRDRGSTSKVAKYLSKYLSKESGRRNYYFLGDLLKIKIVIPKSICNVNLVKHGECKQYVYKYIIHNLDFHKKKELKIYRDCSYYCFVIIPISSHGGWSQRSLILNTEVSN